MLYNCQTTENDCIRIDWYISAINIEPTAWPDSANFLLITELKLIAIKLSHC